MTLDIEEIRNRLPHRYPFLLVDRVVSVGPGERILAYKNLSINEPFFDGHFPGKPVFPGVQSIESVAFSGQSQASFSHAKGKNQETTTHSNSRLVATRTGRQAWTEPHEARDSIS